MQLNLTLSSNNTLLTNTELQYVTYNRQVKMNYTLLNVHYTTEEQFAKSKII